MNSMFLTVEPEHRQQVLRKQIPKAGKLQSQTIFHSRTWIVVLMKQSCKEIVVSMLDCLENNIECWWAFNVVKRWKSTWAQWRSWRGSSRSFSPKGWAYCRRVWTITSRMQPWLPCASTCIRRAPSPSLRLGSELTLTLISSPFFTRIMLSACKCRLTISGSPSNLGRSASSSTLETSSRCTPHLQLFPQNSWWHINPRSAPIIFPWAAINLQYTCRCSTGCSRLIWCLSLPVELLLPFFLFKRWALSKCRLKESRNHRCISFFRQR